jgi:hypothetical protein
VSGQVSAPSPNPTHKSETVDSIPGTSVRMRFGSTGIRVVNADTTDSIIITPTAITGTLDAEVYKLDTIYFTYSGTGDTAKLFYHSTQDSLILVTDGGDTVKIGSGGGGGGGDSTWQQITITDGGIDTITITGTSISGNRDTTTIDADTIFFTFGTADSVRMFFDNAGAIALDSIVMIFSGGSNDTITIGALPPSQSLNKLHLDTTSTFVVGELYKRSSAEGDSVMVTQGRHNEIADDTANFKTAYGWGDHSTEGYILDSGTVPMVGNWNFGNFDLTGGDSTHWNALYAVRAWFVTGSKWRLPRTIGPFGQVLKLDDTANPDTLYWSDSITFADSADHADNVGDPTGDTIKMQADSAMGWYLGGAFSYFDWGTAPSVDNQVWAWNAATSEWTIQAQIGGGGGVDVSVDTTGDATTDVNTADSLGLLEGTNIRLSWTAASRYVSINAADSVTHAGDADSANHADNAGDPSGDSMRVTLQDSARYTLDTLGIMPSDSAAYTLGASDFPWASAYVTQAYLYKDAGTDSWLPFPTSAASDEQVLAYESTGDSLKWKTITGSGNIYKVGVVGNMSDQDSLGFGTSADIAFTIDETATPDSIYASYVANSVTEDDIADGIAGGGLLNDDANNEIDVDTSFFDARFLNASDSGDADLTADVSGILPVENGGTETNTLTDGGVLLGSGVGAITPMAVLGDGALIIGDGVTDPVANVVSGDATMTSGGVLTIANGAVTSAKIALNTIEAADINSNAVDNDELAANAVTSAKIDDGTVAAADLAETYFQTSDFDNVTLDTVAGVLQVKADGIDEGELADASVGSAELTDQAIKGNDVDSTAEDFVFTEAYKVTSAAADSAYATEKYVQLQRDNAKSEIRDTVAVIGTFHDEYKSRINGVLTTDTLDLVQGTGITITKNSTGGYDSATFAATLGTDIALAEMQSNSVDSTKIVDKGVSTSDLQDTSITTAKIADADITETQLAASVAGGGLTGGAGAVLAVGAGTGITVNANDVEAVLGTSISLAEMAANSVDSTKIVDKGINTADLQDTVVTTAKIADNDVTSAKLDDNITLTDLVADSVDVQDLGVDVHVTADSINTQHLVVEDTLVIPLEESTDDPDTKGALLYDTAQGILKIHDGTGSRQLATRTKTVQMTIPDPNNYDGDTLYMFTFDADLYPNGVTILKIAMRLKADAADSVRFWRSTGADPPASFALVNSTGAGYIATTASDTYVELASPGNGAIAADGILWVSPAGAVVPQMHLIATFLIE